MGPCTRSAPWAKNIWKFKTLNSWEISLKSTIYYSHNESHTVSLGGRGATWQLSVSCLCALSPMSYWNKWKEPAANPPLLIKSQHESGPQDRWVIGCEPAFIVCTGIHSPSRLNCGHRAKSEGATTPQTSLQKAKSCKTQMFGPTLRSILHALTFQEDERMWLSLGAARWER